MSKLLLAAGMALICGAAAWGKNNVPDFRYPETVINDATKQIEKADKKRKPQGSCRRTGAPLYRKIANISRLYAGTHKPRGQFRCKSI